MFKGSPSMYRLVLNSSLSRSIRDLNESLSVTDEGGWEGCVPEDVRDA
jgi:hypothetical protein